MSPTIFRYKNYRFFFFSNEEKRKKSKKLGENISIVEIQNISNHGLWVFVKDQEFFIPFEKYPWFKKATIDQIYDFQCYHDKHLHWSALDIDIEIDALKNPEMYPLTYKA